MKFLRIFTALIVLSLLGTENLSAAEINLDRIPMSKTKLDFLKLYKTQWELFALPMKLKKAIDDAYTEQTEELMWGTVAIQLASNYDNIQEKIQQSAEYKFAADYDKFLSELEETWGEKLRDNILDFYKRQSATVYFELSENPMAQAYLRQDYDRITEDNGRAAMSRISKALSEKYSTFEVSGAGLIGGTLMILARKQLTNFVMKRLGRKVAGTALGKLAGGAVPVIGWVMLAWSAWDMYSMLDDVEGTIKAKMFESYNVMYSEEVPLIYWEGMESYVRDAYILTYEQLSESVNRGKSLGENEQLKKLSQGLTQSEQRFFADRTAFIQEIVDGKSYKIDDVLTRYGEFIRDARRNDFDKFAATLAESDNLPESYPPQPVQAVKSADVKSADVKPEAPRKFNIHEGH